MFVGEGPGFNEDRQGRPFVGRAGELLVKLLGSIGWRREDVFITNVVKCRPPDNRDPQPDEIAACAPYLRRQLEVLDPAVVVTLGRHSMARFMPGARISQAHGTVRPVDPETGAARRAGLRDVPPGGRAADAGHRARELRRHGGRPERPARRPRADAAAAAGARRRRRAASAGPAAAEPSHRHRPRSPAVAAAAPPTPDAAQATEASPTALARPARRDATRRSPPTTPTPS